MYIVLLPRYKSTGGGGLRRSCLRYLPVNVMALLEATQLT